MRILRNILACLLLCLCCTGCITAACLAVAAVGVAAVCASNGNSADAAAMPRYLYATVNSGTVSHDITLRYRYRVVASRVVRHTQKGHVEDAYVNSLAHEATGAPLLLELEIMFPGVFFNGEQSLGILVELHVQNAYPSAEGLVPDCLTAGVVVKDALTGEVLGRDGFSETLGRYAQASNNVRVVSSWQTFRDEEEVALEGSVKQTIFEGFAGSIVAALEKSENGGVRQVASGAGPRFVQLVTNAGSPPAPAAAADAASAPVAPQEDHTAEAVDFFMGSMGAINAMQQQRHAQNRARIQQRQAQRAQRQSARTSRQNAANGARTASGASATSSAGAGASASSSAAGSMSSSAATSSSSSGNATSGSSTTKSCGACYGTGNCWACKGKGKFESVEAIANGSVSVRSVMAQRMITCKPCNGTGNCRACGGTGKK